MSLRLEIAEITLKIFHPRGTNFVAMLRQDEFNARREFKYLNSDSESCQADNCAVQRQLIKASSGYLVRWLKMSCFS
jgi:hypothetical protein